ncbi:NADH-quinone oxidoreductase subunit H [Desulfovibrio sp. OttesenSCG-928-A18]|nr:NADH-quinone oxidoreductase subunit H [Desulfovibrio sp. OttesenSCG-928-A18]
MSARILLSLFFVLLSVLLAPLLNGVINRVKAIVAGRKGRPLLQLYYDLFKLMHKNPVYSHTSTWFFRAAPAAGLAATIFALCILPFGPFAALCSFPGDFLLLAGLFALVRFSLILAALDTGSAFEGMGAAREAMFSALAEPILLLSLVVLAYHAGDYSLSNMIGCLHPDLWAANRPFFVMIAIAFFLLLLPENCRIPVDDPNTHLELTMIHEVMILDHSGPDLAFLEYAASLKLWIFCMLISGVLMPSSLTALLAESPPVDGGPVIAFGDIVLATLHTLLPVFGIAVLVGLVESLMARLRLERVPQVLTLAACFAVFAALVLWR